MCGWMVNRNWSVSSVNECGGCSLIIGKFTWIIFSVLNFPLQQKEASLVDREEAKRTKDGWQDKVPLYFRSILFSFRALSMGLTSLVFMSRRAFDLHYSFSVGSSRFFHYLYPAPPTSHGIQWYPKIPCNVWSISSPAISCLTHCGLLWWVSTFASANMG